ncbi:serine hydrolase domain-containing protein [Haloferula sargassicola]|uniref:D-alanyl-D-alanine carboxypeptidase n=1 Tax=Haloferula sargassicola TaxID=490096 RepID=A0ABP9UN88_9BACT
MPSLVPVFLGALGFYAGALHAETTEIEAIRGRHQLPALAVLAAKDGKILEQLATGVRKSGDDAEARRDDPFHLGSCTKAMTATLAGILVDEGSIGWDTSIAEVFPKLAKKMQPDYRAVTLDQLLHNRGGVPTEPPPDAWEEAWKERGSPRKQRLRFIEAVLAQPPAAPPGTRHVYSNSGFAIAGAMLEERADLPWEELITKKLFRPLGMTTAGFGPPGKKGKSDAPWGHERTADGLVPRWSDNPPAIAPAGRVHASLADFARFALLHADGSKLLKPATLEHLHQPAEGGDYACGWRVLKRDWAGGTALTHNGSNTFWYAVVWIAPARHAVFIAATNVAGEAAEKACDEAISLMIGKWLQD